MATKSSESTAAALRYAKALLDLAEESKSTDSVEKDLHDLNAMIEASPDFNILLESQLIGRNHRKAAIMEIAAQAKFSDLTARFLGVLAENARLYQLETVIEVTLRDLSRRRGEVSANVETAFALSPEQTDELRKKISKAMGSNVTLNVNVNNDLIGGMIVTVGSRMIDSSIRRKLERLHRAMRSQTSQGILTEKEEVA